MKFDWRKHLFGEAEAGPSITINSLEHPHARLGRQRFLLKRTNEAGKRPSEIEVNEVVYNSADDVFILGTGDNQFKIYKATD